MFSSIVYNSSFVDEIDKTESKYIRSKVRIKDGIVFDIVICDMHTEEEHLKLTDMLLSRGSIQFYIKLLAFMN